MYESIDPDKLGMPDVTDEIRLALHKKYAKPYIIYKKHNTYVDCYCTHCMTRYRLYLNRERILYRNIHEFFFGSRDCRKISDRQFRKNLK